MIIFSRSLTALLLFAVGLSHIHAWAAPQMSAVTELEFTDRGESDIVVVFEAGFGTDASVWKPVVDAMGEDVRTIAYSRAGLGGSAAADEPRTIEAHLSDLAGLLDTLEITSNIVLVGHSYGGLLAAEMAQAYPDRVIGLVLIDPATRSQSNAFKAADPDRIAADDTMLLNIMPPAMRADYQILINQMDAAEADVTPLPADRPVVLYTSTASFEAPFVFEETPLGRQLWIEIHQDLFQNVKDGQHIRVSTAGHNIHVEQPARIAQDIRALVDRLESKMD